MQNIDIGSNEEEEREDSLENKIANSLGRDLSKKKQNYQWKE